MIHICCAAGLWLVCSANNSMEKPLALAKPLALFWQRDLLQNRKTKRQQKSAHKCILIHFMPISHYYHMSWLCLILPSILVWTIDIECFMFLHFGIFFNSSHVIQISFNDQRNDLRNVFLSFSLVWDGNYYVEFLQQLSQNYSFTSIHFGS